MKGRNLSKTGDELILCQGRRDGPDPSAVHPGSLPADIPFSSHVLLSNGGVPGGAGCASHGRRRWPSWPKAFLCSTGVSQGEVQPARETGSLAWREFFPPAPSSMAWSLSWPRRSPCCFFGPNGEDDTTWQVTDTRSIGKAVELPCRLAKRSQPEPVHPPFLVHRSRTLKPMIDTHPRTLYRINWRAVNWTVRLRSR